MTAVVEWPPDAVPLFTPKGWDNLAQGEALGCEAKWFSSLKGWDRVGRVAALQAAKARHPSTQGFALG